MKSKLSLIIAITLIVSGTSLAQVWVLRTSTSQVRSIITSIERRTDDFKSEMRRSLDRSFENPPNVEDRIMDRIEEFEDSTDRLRNRFMSNRNVSAELNEVFSDAQVINSFMLRNRMTPRAENLWAAVRTDLNTLARYFSGTWNWNQPIVVQPGVPIYPPFSATEAQVRNLIRQIENKTDVYRNRMGNALDRSRFDGRPQEEEIMNYISEFESSTDRLRDRFNSRQSTVADVNEVLLRAAYIDQFMARNALARPAENQWRLLKNDLNTLALYYRVTWNWNQTLPPFVGGRFPGQFETLTGTYRLNHSRSDNVTAVVNRSIGYYPSNRREMVRRNLERRLASPEMIAIDTNGRTVMMGTSSAQRVEFIADGVGRTETNPRGRRVTTTATLDRSGLEVNYTGDRVNDFYVSFTPSGDQLIVTKRIYLENRNDLVTVRSVYDRVSDVADWSMVNAGPTWGGGPIAGGEFYVPNGTILNATLRNTVSTRGSQIGDRFTMVVNSPGQYRGAVIEGRVVEAERSGRFSGRANIALDFDTITVGGRTYRFAGIINSVNAINGDSISVNNEGTIRDSSRTTQTVARAGVGALLGAIIGAIAGGGEGAAIGAGVGAGVGAGSVLITGRDNIELGAGSAFNITATAPLNNRVGAN